ncbi:MAG: LPS export ABC transporter ATP-binding protein [Deltaproteobacteria bacterium]|nr:LPS export ABC transporter ATP-binding protein [Deltaproteobacteria bacterium]
MPVLTLKNLEKTYHGRRVVDSVSLEVNSKNVVGLLGPNGAGKTTTFYMAVGMIKADGGEVLINNENITEYPMYLRARKGIGYLPQEVSIFKKLTVKENVMAILEILPFSDSERENRTDSLLEELGIRHLSDHKASVLSGGERRRLEITRVLATDPSFILLDEPFAGIDPLAIIDIQNIITQLTERDIGILISDHNVRETLGVCDSAFILNNGKVIESGNPEKIATSKIARKIYLGEEFKL